MKSEIIMLLGSVKQNRAAEALTQLVFLALMLYSFNEKGYKVDNRS